MADSTEQTSAPGEQVAVDTAEAERVELNETILAALQVFGVNDAMDALQHANKTSLELHSLLKGIRSGEAGAWQLRDGEETPFLEQWLNCLLRTAEKDTEHGNSRDLCKVMRFIAENEDHPPPEECLGIDLRQLYMGLSQMMIGESPRGLNAASAGFLHSTLAQLQSLFFSHHWDFRNVIKELEVSCRRDRTATYSRQKEQKFANADAAFMTDFLSKSDFNPLNLRPGDLRLKEPPSEVHMYSRKQQEEAECTFTIHARSSSSLSQSYASRGQFVKWFCPRPTPKLVIKEAAVPTADQNLTELVSQPCLASIIKDDSMEKSVRRKPLKRLRSTSLKPCQEGEDVETNTTVDLSINEPPNKRRGRPKGYKRNATKEPPVKVKLPPGRPKQNRKKRRPWVVAKKRKQVFSNSADSDSSGSGAVEGPQTRNCDVAAPGGSAVKGSAPSPDFTREPEVRSSPMLGLSLGASAAKLWEEVVVVHIDSDGSSS